MKFWLILCSLVLLTRPILALPLVTRGEPKVVIVLSASPEQAEVVAAEELVLHIEKITGASVKVSEAPRSGLFPIWIGGAAGDSSRAYLEHSNDPCAFALVVDDKGVEVVGKGPEGVLIGVYELLEQLGVRWFLPGEDNTVFPEKDTLELLEQVEVQEPSFSARWLQGGVAMDKEDWKIWLRRNRMGGPYFPGAHRVRLAAGVSFSTHSELFALVGGVRSSRQLCVSDPDTIESAALGLSQFFEQNPELDWVGAGPGDGWGFCECAGCSSLDGGDVDPLTGELSMTDRYVWFLNQVVQLLDKEYSRKRICFYAYDRYMRPPVRVKPSPRLVPALAPIDLCRIHGVCNPVCPEKDLYRSLVSGWLELVPEVYDRGYWFNLADPGLSFPMVHRMRDQIPEAKRLGIRGWRVECQHHWAAENPSLYIASRLMWNHEADVDLLLEDFFQRYYGPAEEPMARVFAVLDDALGSGDYHAGSSHDIHLLYPRSLREKVSGLLAEAAGSAKREVYKQRVRVARWSFEYTASFIEMIELRNQHRYSEAMQALAHMKELSQLLTAESPPMINKRFGPKFLNRFYARGLVEAYGLVSEGKELLSMLDSDWLFLEDPGKRTMSDVIPESLDEVSWRKISTSNSWSSQGLRYFRGSAWYKKSIFLPPIAKDRKVFLWFNAVDEAARVWVNGVRVGEFSQPFVPFRFEVTGAVRAGRNEIVVQTVNVRTNELGTGGIIGPCFVFQE